MNSLIILFVYKCLNFPFIFEGYFYDQLPFFNALNKLLFSGFFFFFNFTCWVISSLSSCCFFVSDVAFSPLATLKISYLYSHLLSVTATIQCWICSLSSMSVMCSLYFQPLLLWIFVLQCGYFLLTFFFYSSILLGNQSLEILISVIVFLWFILLLFKDSRSLLYFFIFPSIFLSILIIVIYNPLMTTPICESPVFCFYSHFLFLVFGYLALCLF